jgi:hypothetical protein
MASATHSTFDNLSPAQIADELGGLDVQSKAIEARMSALKAELKRRGTMHAAGERFAVTRSDAQRWSLDTASVRAEMGEAWCNSRSKMAAVTSFRLAAVHSGPMQIAA